MEEYPEDLKKMKVPELRQALKEKGLSTVGTKPELIKRLHEAGKLSDSKDPVLDEDEILKDDPCPPSELVSPSISTIDTAKVESEAKDAQILADTTAPPKPVEVKKMTDAERLKLRAEKFGVASEQSKKELRAQRFGLASVENKLGTITSSNTPVDPKKLKERAERFGVTTSKVLDDEKKRKRAERFGEVTSSTKSTTSTDSDLEAKKRKRAERFGLS